MKGTYKSLIYSCWGLYHQVACFLSSSTPRISKRTLVDDKGYTRAMYGALHRPQFGQVYPCLLANSGVTQSWYPSFSVAIYVLFCPWMPPNSASMKFTSKSWISTMSMNGLKLRVETTFWSDGILIVLSEGWQVGPFNPWLGRKSSIQVTLGIVGK